MIDHSLLYVSRKRIDPADEAAVALFLPTARTRNKGLDVTGTLISADAWFAQILEGAAVALDELMGSINQDERHTDVTLLRTVPIEKRSFRGWELAYSGPSTYLADRIAPLVGITANEKDWRVDELIAVMTGLGTAEGR